MKALTKGVGSSRNAPENPTGIETKYAAWCFRLHRDVATHQKTRQGLKQIGAFCEAFAENSRNAPENPTGIETFQRQAATKQDQRSQRTRKPDRD